MHNLRPGPRLCRDSVGEVIASCHHRGDLGSPIGLREDRSGGSLLAAYSWMLTGCVFFTLMGVFAHDLGAHFPWQIVALARAGLVLLIMGGFCLLWEVPLVFLRPRILWMRSIAGSVSLVCTFYALTRLPISQVFTLTNTFPIWVALLSWPMLGKVPARSVWVAVFCAVLGVWLMQDPGGTDAPIAWLPSLAALGAALATAFAMLGLNRLGHLDPRAVVVHFSLVATLTALATLLVFDWQQPNPAGAERLDILRFLGIGVTATIGQLALTRAFGTGDPTTLSIVGLCQVPMGAVLDLCWSGHPLLLMNLIGMGMILGPTAWVILSRRKQPRALAHFPPTATSSAETVSPTRHC